MTRDSWTRPAAVAGRFYPADAAALRTMLETFLTGAEAGPPVRAIVAPHAGYVYSGRFAGVAYRRVGRPAVALVLCPNHTGAGRRVSVWSRGSWETPLGPCAVDEPLAARFLALAGEAEGDREAHRFEHAIEVHVPFLQWLNPAVRLVPVVLGRLRLDECRRVGAALAALQAECPEALLVASTDMSHYVPAAAARELDALALERVAALDAEGLHRTVTERRISMCGYLPTTAVLDAMRRRGAAGAELVAYGHSGEVTGDERDVVAYAAAVVP